ncbi:MAG: class I SAM-dependent rRNA methyltransferase [Campylobacterota bacterium]|nr:class I SAM-dependent rRNA methyltransferase [Campylobacterota bacterium]
MNKTINLQIKPNFIEQYKKGYPLITPEYIFDLEDIDDGTIVNLVDNKKRFISKGYLGRQNKGYGWVLSLKDEQIDTDFFKIKIKEALDYRDDFFKSSDTTAFRVFNSQGDGIGGLTIDYFSESNNQAGCYMITWYSNGIYKFKKQIVDALEAQVNYKAIYQKKRFDTKGQYIDDKDDFVSGERVDFPIQIKENGVHFAIYLDDGPMTGIFLDQKVVRKTIMTKYSKGKTILNTFSYTGAFSVYAALGGALKTTSVDLANRSFEKTAEQFKINNIDPSTQDIIVEDVFHYFKYAVKKNMLFDMVVVDPPSFARSKKNTFSVSKDYTKLLKEIIQITKKGGMIVASTNYANLNMKRFRDFIDKAFKESNSKYIIEDVYALPKDFKVSKSFLESDYLKVIFIKKIK